MLERDLTPIEREAAKLCPVPPETMYHAVEYVSDLVLEIGWDEYRRRRREVAFRRLGRDRRRALVRVAEQRRRDAAKGSVRRIVQDG